MVDGSNTATIEITQGDKKVQVSPEDLQDILMSMIKISDITVSLSPKRQTPDSRFGSDGYFISESLTGIESLYTTLEGAMPPKEARKIISSVLVRRVEMCFDFMRHVLSKQFKLDGIPLENFSTPELTKKS